jgi:hypothetical protein
MHDDHTETTGQIISQRLFKQHAMKTYCRVEVQLHVFLTSALDGGEWSASSPGSFTPAEIVPDTQCIVDWVGPSAGPDAVE